LNPDPESKDYDSSADNEFVVWKKYSSE
jgi:hypothetical protein